VSGHFGFKDECKAKYGLSLYYRFLLCFQCLPLACRVATPHGDVLCLHGGLSPEVTSPYVFGWSHTSKYGYATRAPSLGPPPL
jgi:diadenosine tetraphosphatase ApaH/serine/threonine PP2A family protein phosphatase